MEKEFIEQIECPCSSRRLQLLELKYKKKETTISLVCLSCGTLLFLKLNHGSRVTQDNKKIEPLRMGYVG